MTDKLLDLTGKFVRKDFQYEYDLYSTMNTIKAIQEIMEECNPKDHADLLLNWCLIYQKLFEKEHGGS